MAAKYKGTIWGTKLHKYIVVLFTNGDELIRKDQIIHVSKRQKKDSERHIVKIITNEGELKFTTSKKKARLFIDNFLLSYER